MKKNKLFGSRLLNAVNTVGFMGVIKIIIVKMRLYFLKKKKVLSHSQLFEDYMLDIFLKHKGEGFYVDVGANDPFNLNNTALFYQKNGWHGINVEPDIDKFRLLQEKRLRDLNINMGVSADKGIIKFYRFEDSSLNTFSSEEAKKRMRQGLRIIDEVNISVDTMASILKNNLPNSGKIDFMSIDVEGLNLEVLKSNDWNKYRPKYLCVEVAEYCKNILTKDAEIVIFLKNQGYKEIFFNGINSIFMDLKNE